jgi:hypothetical protein
MGRVHRRSRWLSCAVTREASDAAAAVGLPWTAEPGYDSARGALHRGKGAGPERMGFLAPRTARLALMTRFDGAAR